MKYLTLLLALICYTFFPSKQMGLKAQSSTPLVELIEDKKAKRWNMYAQNNTDEEQEAFLMVHLRKSVANYRKEESRY